MAGDADRALVTLAELIELVRAAPRSVGLVVETKHPTRDGARVDAEVARVLTAGGLGGAAGPRWGGSVAPVTVLSFWFGGNRFGHRVQLLDHPYPIGFRIKLNPAPGRPPPRLDETSRRPHRIPS